jgi:hypothetical protein
MEHERAPEAASAEPPDESPVVLVKGQRHEEDWEAFKDRVVRAFRNAGLLKD